MKLKTLLTVFGIGAGLMYFGDPELGARRRAMIRGKVNGLAHDIENTYDTGLQDIRNRARGAMAEMTGRLGDQGAPDWVLEERVRTKLGRLPVHARSVEVRATGGRVQLSGPVLRDERDAVLAAASATRGVDGVDDQMQVFDNPRDIPALQGIPATGGQAAGWQQGTMPPAARLAAGVGGTVLMLYGFTRRGLMKPLLSTAGLTLAARGFTDLDMRSMLGLGMGSNAIQVRKAINIDAPVHEVYQFWHNFENFPRFMEHVKEIHVQDGLTTWKVAGPAGVPVEFQSRITRDVPDQMIAWETVPDSQVQHRGFVRFDPNPDGGTRVFVQMSYVPPAGVAGHAVAQLFGVDPRQAMNDDLMRLKGLLEQGKTSTSQGGEVTKEEVKPS